MSVDLRTPPLSKEKVLSRQRELLNGVHRLLVALTPDEHDDDDDDDWLQPERIKELAVFIWTTACVVWQNVSDDVMRAESVAVCLEVSKNSLCARNYLLASTKHHRIFYF